MLPPSRYTVRNDAQHLFDQALGGILLFISLLLKMVTHSPFLLAAWFISSLFLTRQNSGLIWITTITLLAYIIYRLTTLVVTVVLALKRKQNLLWIFLFLLLLLFTLGLPFYLIWEMIIAIVPSLSTNLLTHTLLTFTFTTFLCFRSPVFTIIRK